MTKMNTTLFLENELKNLSDSMLLASDLYEESNLRYRSDKRTRQISVTKFSKRTRHEME